MNQNNALPDDGKHVCRHGKSQIEIRRKTRPISNQHAGNAEDVDADVGWEFDRSTVRPCESVTDILWMKIWKCCLGIAAPVRRVLRSCCTMIYRSFSSVVTRSLPLLGRSRTFPDSQNRLHKCSVVIRVQPNSVILFSSNFFWSVDAAKYNHQISTCAARGARAKALNLVFSWTAWLITVLIKQVRNDYMLISYICVKYNFKRY